jgi:hypothetical protein
MKKSLWKYQLKYWLPVYTYLISIFYFSSQSIIPASIYLTEQLFIKPFLQHILVYMGLALLLYRAIKYSKESPGFLVVVSTTLYGFTDELHQHFVPGRIFSSSDILMDFIGALLALILISIFRKKANR